MRLRFNGFDALVLLSILALVFLVAHRGLTRAPLAASTDLGTAASRPVEFSITTMPTHYARSMVSHLQPRGQVSVQTGGNFVPMGTLQSVTEQPYMLTVNNGLGSMVVTSDPTERVLKLTVVAKAVVDQKTITINGNPYYVDQHAVFREGGAEFQGTITDEQVR